MSKLDRISQIYTFVFLVNFILVSYADNEDLYNVLGVERSATTQEIKRAYKKLARDWHPDKNKEEGANEHFMKINEAYETLGDSERRKEYDRFGYTTLRDEGHRGHGHQDGFGDFESFFSGGPFGGGFKFHFGHGGSHKLSKDRLTLRSYELKVLPESHTRPYLLYLYSDFCMACLRVEPIWEKIVKDLEETGLGYGTVNINMDKGLAYTLRMDHAPEIIAVVNGRPKYYRGDFSVANIRNFIRGLFPKKLITMLNADTWQYFLDGYEDNKMRVILFSEKETPTLRYVAPAFKHQQRFVYGYIHMGVPETKSLLEKYGVKRFKETLLVFNEENENPVASVSMDKISRTTIVEILENNKYLLLPRISSQAVFNEICPVEPRKKKRRLCIVLLTRNTELHESHRVTFRKFATRDMAAKDQIQFTYIYEDKQHKFIHALTQGGSHGNNNTVLKVAILWRKDSKSSNYDWFEPGWAASGDYHETGKQLLLDKINSILMTNEVLALNTVLAEILDEHALGLLSRIWLRLVDYADIAYHFTASMDMVTVSTFALTIFFILSMGYIINTFAEMENKKYSENILNEEEKKERRRRRRGEEEYRPPQECTVYLQELRSETFEELVRKSPQGNVTLLILLTEDTKDKLLQRYAEILKPLTRSRFFKFSFLMLDQHYGWYIHLLEEATEFRVSLDINIRNCVGTVLAINGCRKYFCIYHAHVKQKKKKDHSGSFLGFDDDSSSDSSSDGEDIPIFESDLLVGLSNWIDRFIDGSLKKFKLEYWPEI